MFTCAVSVRTAGFRHVNRRLFPICRTPLRMLLCAQREMSIGLAFFLALIAMIVAAVVPTAAYVVLFNWADRYEREPWRLLLAAFLWGAIPAIILSLLAEQLVGASLTTGTGSLAETLVEGVIAAPVIEEVAKALALLGIYRFARDEFDGVLDGLVYGALVGLGFAMTENFLYFVGSYDAGGFPTLGLVIFLRTILFGLNHAFYTALTGIGLGLAVGAARRGQRVLLFLAGLAGATIVHALHNLGAGLSQANPAGILISLFLVVANVGLVLMTVRLAWRNEQQALVGALEAEVDVLLTPAEYALLISTWHRPLTRAAGQMSATLEGDGARMHAAVELALRRKRLDRINVQSGHVISPRQAGRIRNLEETIVALRTSLAATYPQSASKIDDTISSPGESPRHIA